MSDEAPRVFGRYELVRKVATGGMAEIWLARQTGPASFSRQLVLKMILPELADDEGFVEMFLDEAKVSAQLVHPNIAQIYDFGQADGTYFLAMELVRGPNLKRLHWFAQKRRMPLPFELIAKLVAQAAAGLDHAHRLLGEDGKPLGVIHRDVTPTNMVCAYEGETKVLDFGIARAEQRVTKTQAGVIKGKYAYMSPEQIDGTPLDPRSDVFSLGATLFELTCNERAFPAEGELELVQQICDQDVRRPRSIRPDVPEHLEEIILNCLARDREQRFRTARALGEALERFAHKQARGPVTKGRVSDYLEALKVAVGDGLDPFALGSGTAAGTRTPGPAAALAIREALRPAAGPGSIGWQEGSSPQGGPPVAPGTRTPGPAGAIPAGRGTPGPAGAIPAGRGTPGPAGALAPKGGTPGPAGALAPKGGTPGPAGALAPKGGTPGPAGALAPKGGTPGPVGAYAPKGYTPGPAGGYAPAALPSPQGTLLGMTAADAGPTPGPGTLVRLPEGAAQGRSQTVGTGIGRPEPLAFGHTESSESVPTLVADQPGPPRSPSDPQRPPRREAPAPVVLQAPLEAAPAGAQGHWSDGSRDPDTDASTQAAPLGERETHLQLSIAEEPTRLKYLGEAPRTVEVGDDAEALAFPRRSPAKLAAMVVGGVALLAAVAIAGAHFLGGGATTPTVAPAGGGPAPAGGGPASAGGGPAPAGGGPASPGGGPASVVPGAPGAPGAPVAPGAPDAAGAPGAVALPGGEAAPGAQHDAAPEGLPVPAPAPVDGAGAAPVAGQPAPVPGSPEAHSGAVTVRVLPYGIVELDGRELGMSPFDTPLAILAGEHKLVVHNPDNGKSETRSLKVVAGEPLELNFDLR